MTPYTLKRWHNVYRKMNVTAGSVQFYNDHYLRTDADSAIHGIVGVYGNGSRNENVSVTTHNFDI